MKRAAIATTAVLLLLLASGAVCVFVSRRCAPVTVRVTGLAASYPYGQDIAFTAVITKVSARDIRIAPPEFWPNPSDPRNSLEFRIRSESGRNLQRISHTLTSKILAWTNPLQLQLGQSVTTTVHMFNPSGGMWDRIGHDANFFSYAGQPAAPGCPDMHHYLTTGVYRVRLVYGIGREHRRQFDRLEQDCRRVQPEHTNAPPALCYSDMWYGTVDSDEFRVTIEPSR
jgi:hypothetical protein